MKMVEQIPNLHSVDDCDDLSLMCYRWQSQQVGGGMGMGGGGMARSGGGGGGMMNTQPDATMKAVNMLVGMLRSVQDRRMRLYGAGTLIVRSEKS